LKSSEITNFTIAGKYGTSASKREWLFNINGSDKLSFFVQDASGGYQGQTSTDALTFENDWAHVAVTYGGSGPNSASGFTAASDEVTLFVNGVAIDMTSGSGGTYVGMSNTSQALWLGKLSTTFSKGSIRGVKIFNRKLTSTEIAQLARGNDLGFSEEWGGAHGGVYTSDFSAGVDGFLDTRVTSAGNIDAIGGQDDNLRITVTDTSNNDHRVTKSAPFATGRRYRVKFSSYIPSSNSNVDGFRLDVGNTGYDFDATSPTLDQWNTHEFEVLNTGNAFLYLYLADGGNITFQDAGGDDVAYFRGFSITEIGTLADFRSERYDTSTNKLYDISDSAFVGTGTSVTLTGREVPVYETGTWTGVYEPTTGSFATMTMDTDLIYTRIGNLVTITGSIQTDNVDTTGGSGSLKITGLPFFAAKVSTCQIGFAWNWGTNFPLNAIVSGSTIYLYTRSSTTARTDDILVTDLSTGAVANRNTLYISATYKIQ